MTISFDAFFGWKRICSYVGTHRTTATLNKLPMAPKGLSVLKTLKVTVLVFLLLAVCIGPSVSIFGLRIVVFPPASRDDQGVTVIMRGLHMLPIVTDAGKICINPDAHVVTASEVKICSNSVLAALARHGSVVARLPYIGVLERLAVD